MNSRVLFLIVGLGLGALTGWLTRPEASEIKVGPISIEVQGDHAAGAHDTGSLTNGQIQHIAVYAVAGGVLGALAGLLVARRG
jgi:hypothetical protein